MNDAHLPLISARPCAVSVQVSGRGRGMETRDQMEVLPRQNQRNHVTLEMSVPTSRGTEINRPSDLLHNCGETLNIAELLHLPDEPSGHYL